MRINVVSVGKPWQPDPERDPMWTIIIQGIGEPQKTFDPLLAQVGTHDAEVFTSKTGKEYWRSPKAGDRDVNGPGGSPTAPIGVPPTGQQPATKWQPKDESAIKAMWAIGQAVQLTIANGKLDLEAIEADASHLFGMVDRVKHPRQIVKVDYGDFAGAVELPPVEAYNEGYDDYSM